MKLKYKITKEGCWACTSHCTNSEGYVKVNIDGKQEYGHRYMFEQKKGKLKNEVVRHTCDNRWCINPDHLIEGTNKDNVLDRVKKNRSAIGEKNGRSKLKKKEVVEIFLDEKTPKMILAKKFNIDPKLIRKIKQRKIWKHITENI